MSKIVGMIMGALASFSSPVYASCAMLLLFALLSLIYGWLAIPFPVIMAGLLMLLTVVCYQTILAYPSGGGAYIVARDQWGEATARTAGAVLLVDSILTIAISVVFAVDQMANAFPTLFAYKVQISLFLILLITCVNLRGAKESNAIFVISTYCFVALILVLLGVGFWQVLNGSLRIANQISDSPPALLSTSGFIFVFLLLRRLNSGAWATQRTRAKNAAITLLWDAALLLLLFLGMSLLSDWIQVPSAETGALISQVARTIYGDGLLWLLTLAAATVVLLTVANHSLLNFPRLAALQAGDGCLPKQFTCQGERPVFQWGLLGLATLASLLIVLFQGHLHRLIPLYAINVFFSFTFVQLGLAKRWWHIGALMQTGTLTPDHEICTVGSRLLYDRFWSAKLLVNGVGAGITALITVGLMVSNFTAGAWIVILLISILWWCLMRMQQHHKAVAHLLRTSAERLI